MAALRQDYAYGIICEKSLKTPPSKTLYHVKLTETAIRSLEAYQNLKGCTPNEPSICFNGSQGHIKIPTPCPESLGGVCIFSFYLSRESKDKPQASFDCVHQYSSSDGEEKLEDQGSIQDKITVCATDASYQITCERMSQVERETWSRSAIAIRPRTSHQNQFVKFRQRSSPPPASPNFQNDSSNTKSDSTQGKLCLKPFQMCVIHLLALKPYRKPELLLWLEKNRASPEDKANLSAVLEEVAKICPKDNSFRLKDDFYKHIQRDWPGYREEEKQFINKLLARKFLLHIGSHSQCFQTNRLFCTTSGNSSSCHSSVNNLSMVNPRIIMSKEKRPGHSEPPDRLGMKRLRVLNRRLNPQLPNNWQLKNKEHVLPARNPSFQTETLQRTSNQIGSKIGSPGSRSAFPPPHKLSVNSNMFWSMSRDSKLTLASRQQALGNLDCSYPLVTNSHTENKWKWHKEKEIERLKNNQGCELLEAKQSPAHFEDDTNVFPYIEEQPNYKQTYSTITTAEQRQRYLDYFCVEYDEYRDLHSRIATITQMFVQLGTKIRGLPFGTEEYKVTEDQILEKYNKYTKEFPGYREEKKRCEYLHEKLSHIKNLIIDYDAADHSS